MVRMSKTRARVGATRFAGARVAALLIGGAVSWAGQAVAAGAGVEVATAAQKEDAQQKFKVGMARFEGKRFDKALEAFRGSYDVVASPNSLLMVARTLRELGRGAEAWAAFDRAEREAERASAREPKYQQAAQAARDERDEVRTRIGFLALEVRGASPATRVLVAGRPVEPSALGAPVAVDPGTIAVSVEHPGAPGVRKTVVVTAGATERVAVDVGEGRPKPGGDGDGSDKLVVSSSKVGMRTWAYVAGGVGVAGLVTFGVFGLKSRSTYNDLEASCPGGHCPADRGADIDAGKRDQTIANVGLVVGVIGLAAGTTLFVLSRKRGAGSGGATAGAPAGAAVAVGPGAVSFGGSF
jgi:hypothetical protein